MLRGWRLLLVEMRISVVIPVVNEKNNLSTLLPALQPLRAAGHELIVVDGGSTDDSMLLASGYVDKLLVSLCGRARQMNCGAAQASGEVLLFLHADSRLPENATVLIQNAIKQGARWGRFKVQIHDNALLLRIVSWLMNSRSLLTGIVTGDQGMFVRRDLFEQVAGFADIPLMEDIEISSRLKISSKPTCVPGRILTCSRRWRQNGILKTIFSMWRFRLQYWVGVSADHLVVRYYPQMTGQREPGNEYAVFVFARAPVSGQVKTRLSPVLDAEARNGLQNELNEHALVTAMNTGLAVELWTTDAVHPVMRDLADRHHVVLHEQTGADLGERMSAAIAEGLQRYKGIVLIGSDCPAMQAEYITLAVEHMRVGQKDIVIGPAEDGGYVLLAARRLYKPMFEGVTWGSSGVYSQSIASLHKAGIAHTSLAILWDVDRPEDYARYRQLVTRLLAGQAIAASA